LRAAFRIIRLALLLLAYVLPHLWSKRVRGTSPWPRRFLRRAAAIVGARVTVAGAEPEAHTLLLANHTSWLDILVLSGATGCAFVSKDGLGHPLIHWLADQNHTIYVDRSARRSVGDQVSAIREALLAARRPIALFPEGTTGPGDRLLPFRPSLLAAVAPPPGESVVQPVAIDYASLASTVGWYSESGKSNVLRILGRRGRIPVTVRVLEPLPRSGDRKALAALAQDRIAAALAASSSPATRL